MWSCIGTKTGSPSSSPHSSKEFEGSPVAEEIKRVMEGSLVEIGEIKIGNIQAEEFPENIQAKVPQNIGENIPAEENIRQEESVENSPQVQVDLKEREGTLEISTQKEEEDQNILSGEHKVETIVQEDSNQQP